MRRTISAVAVVVAVAVLYLGSAIWSVSLLLEAVRAGDGPAIVSHTDLPRLRASLLNQVIDAYLAVIGAKRPLAQLAASAYGPTIADPLIEKILNDGLTRLLQQGIVLDPVKSTARAAMPALGSLNPGELLSLVSRIEPTKLLEFRLRITGSKDPLIYTAAQFRLEGPTWKLSGLRLPPAMATDLAVMIVEMTRH